MAKRAGQYARRGIGLLPVLLAVGLANCVLAGCVSGRNYSIADSANPGSGRVVEAAAVQDGTEGDPSVPHGRFRRFVFRSGTDGLEVVAQSAAVQGETTVAATLTTIGGPRYLAGNLVAANLTTTVNGGGMVGLTAAMPLTAVNVALAGGVLTGAASSNLQANNLLVASFSTQSAPVTSTGSGGTVSVGGGAASGGGSTGSSGTVGGTIGSTVGGTGGGTGGSVGGGVTTPITGTAPGAGTTGSVIGSVAPTITPSGVTGKGISGLTASVLPH